MRHLKLVGMYAGFAAISILANIGTQALCVYLYRGPYYLPLSMCAGTATGLISKYLLDKYFIFSHKSEDLGAEATTFVLYIAMGLITTIIFWGTEALFQVAFRSDAMRYVGGVIGLCFGYTLKYWLDKKFVFNNDRSRH